jgi:hypothetical protein
MMILLSQLRHRHSVADVQTCAREYFDAAVLQESIYENPRMPKMEAG